MQQQQKKLMEEKRYLSSRQYTTIAQNRMKAMGLLLVVNDLVWEVGLLSWLLHEW